MKKALYLVDLFFPPMLNLLLGYLVVVAVHAFASSDPGLARLSHALIPIHASCLLVLAVYALAPIYAMSLPARYLVTTLLASPYYLAWKLVTTLARPPARWVRTDREAAGE